MKRLILPAVLIGLLAPAGISAAFGGDLSAQGLDDPRITAPKHECFFIFPRWRVPCGSTSSRSEREDNDRGRAYPLRPPPVTDEMSSSTVSMSKQAAFERAYGRGDFKSNIATHKAENGGNWSDEARDIHARDVDWAEFEG